MNDKDIIISKLQQENEKLKKQYCERTDCAGRIGNSKIFEELRNENKKLAEDKLEYLTIYGKMLTSQDRFIKYLEKLIIDSKAGSGQQYWYQECLKKYKEIIGDYKNVKN